MKNSAGLRLLRCRVQTALQAILRTFEGLHPFVLLFASSRDLDHVRVTLGAYHSHRFVTAGENIPVASRAFVVTGHALNRVNRAVVRTTNLSLSFQAGLCRTGSGRDRDYARHARRLGHSSHELSTRLLLMVILLSPIVAANGQKYRVGQGRGRSPQLPSRPGSALRDVARFRGLLWALPGNAIDRVAWRGGRYDATVRTWRTTARNRASREVWPTAASAELR